MEQKVLDFRSVFSQAASVLLDTSVLIYYLEEVEPYYPLVETIFNDILDNNISSFLSAISITEFVTKPFTDGKGTDVERFKQFLSSLSIQVLAVTYEIAERAGKLRSQYLSTRTPDALIIATALENGCDVFVTNDKNLKKFEVPGLTVIVLEDFVVGKI
ncbi:MAG: PIN domain-containing protein [Candidatus Poribacteria bacterium]|nr:PIN domain-containing protein [Candidatus Poribacteria bacterium]